MCLGIFFWPLLLKPETKGPAKVLELAPCSLLEVNYGLCSEDSHSVFICKMAL